MVGRNDVAITNAMNVMAHDLAQANEAVQGKYSHQSFHADQPTIIQREAWPGGSLCMVAGY